MTADDILKRLIAQRVVPVLRLADAEIAESAFECLVKAGFSAIEITMTVPGAVDLIARLAEKNAGLLIGAGTVLDLPTARRCIDAGAHFVVSPCLVPGMAGMAHLDGCVAMQGGYTPAEILEAHRDGADIVKVFPASSGGPEHLRAVHAVLPDVLLCPSGGVSLDNIQAYLAAGASLVCVGNNILDPYALAAGDATGMVAYARRYLDILASSPATLRGTAG